MAQPTLASRFCAVTGCSVHSFRIILLRLFKSTNTQRRSLKQHRHRVVVNTPKRYMQLRVGLKDKAARVGFEPATYRTQGTEPTTEPPHPIILWTRLVTLLLINDKAD